MIMAAIREILKTYKAELEALKRDDDLLRVAQRLYLEKVLQSIKDIIKTVHAQRQTAASAMAAADKTETVVDEATLIKHLSIVFDTSMAILQGEMSGTAMSILADLNAPGNRCALAVFKCLYPGATSKQFLRTFFPVVTQKLVFSIAGSLAPAASIEDLQFTLAPQPIIWDGPDADDDEIDNCHVSELIVSGDTVLCVPDIAQSLTHTQKQLALLQVQYPRHDEKLRRHNPVLESFFEGIALLYEGYGKTLRQVLQELRDVFLSQGERITRRDELSTESQKAIAPRLNVFNAYVSFFANKGPLTELEQQLLKKLQDLIPAEIRCIEGAASRAVEILRESEYQELLRYCPSLTPEKRQALERNLRNPQQISTQGHEQTRALPAAFFAGFVSQVKITTAEELCRILQRFESLEQYEEILSYNQSAVARISSDFFIVAKVFLSKTEISILCEALTRLNLWVDIMKLSVLQEVLPLLPTDLLARILCLETVREIFRHQIYNVFILMDLLDASPDQIRMMVFEALKDEVSWIGIIRQNTAGLTILMKRLLPEERLIFCDPKKAILEGVISEAWQCAEVFALVDQHLPQQRPQIFALLQKRLDLCIKDFESFSEVLACLMPDEIKVIFSRTEQRLGKLLAYSLKETPWLESGRVTTVAACYLPKLLTYLSCLTQRALLLSALNGRWYEIKFPVEGIETLVQYLPDDRQHIPYELLSAQIADLQLSAESLTKLVKQFTDKERLELTETCRRYCEDFFRAYYDLLNRQNPNFSEDIVTELPVTTQTIIVFEEQMAKEIFEILSAVNASARRSASAAVAVDLSRQKRDGLLSDKEFDEQVKRGNVLVVEFEDARRREQEEAVEAVEARLRRERETTPFAHSFFVAPRSPARVRPDPAAVLSDFLETQGIAPPRFRRFGGFQE